ncbi:MAG: GntR family transcriptional regulator [Anaerolineae bacterium]|nr:GntR family transcriptional regulator [Thermoflexales bacterium]MDW8408922.1 GntR family transcriptional regulator [Anaerolineae bacterium]
MSSLDSSGPIPLYTQIAEEIKRQIERGELRPGDRLWSEAELCKRFQVSRGTVREALDLLSSAGLLQRIAGKGTFIAEPSSAKQSRLLGMIVPYLRDSLTTDMLRGVESVLHRAGYSLIFCHSDGDLKVEEAQLVRLKSEGVSGLILFPLATAGEAALIRQHFPPAFPLVVVDRRLPGIEADAVLADNYHGAYQAVRHLLSVGHRRVACVAPPDRPSSVQDRIRGYEQALREAGILPLAAVSLALQGGRPNTSSLPEYSEEELEPVLGLLNMSDAPTALFCINDFIALGVMRHLIRHKIRVPEDIAIAGFDNLAIAAYMPTPLTTVAQPKHAIGIQAAELLLSRIEQPTLAPREIIVPTELVIRASSGAPSNTAPAKPTRRVRTRPLRARS